MPSSTRKNRWKEIWNQRQVEDTGEVLEMLLKADGYDSAFGAMGTDAFMDFIDNVEKELAVSPGDSIFEVGCGAGAVLYPFFTRGHDVGGIDYSVPLIDKASEMMPGMAFSANEAIHMDTETHFEIVLSCGAFIYFENFDYAESVLHRMLKKSVKAVGIFDVSDLDLKQEAETFRRNGMGAETYAAAYEGLHHLYYPKSFFENIASDAGCRIRIFPQSIEGYRNSAYRYNVLIWKKAS
jgi:trans-aconitate methyltransferase